MPYIHRHRRHIDHGKTSLIKALTGQDTDRLKGRKRARPSRSTLGFAHPDLRTGPSAGVVDVPGHERFIKNMLAAPTASISCSSRLAAGDGVMPQSEEHLDIVHLLGVKLAIS